jgi:hypothetical protein
VSPPHCTRCGKKSDSARRLCVEDPIRWCCSRCGDWVEVEATVVADTVKAPSLFSWTHPRFTVDDIAG